MASAERKPIRGSGRGYALQWDKFNLSHVSNTRGNIYKMQLTHLHYKHFFSNRIVAIWNSLPNMIVSAESTNIFKNRLDKLWAHPRF